MRLLVLGAGGQVGHELCRLAWPAGYSIAALDRAGVDITEREKVFAAVARERPDIVVNAAAYTAVDRAESEPDIAWAGNCTGPANLAAACRDALIPLIHLSTDYVFDGSKPGAYREDDPVKPLGVYGKSKEAGDRAVRDALPRHVILRTAWVYSAHGRNFVRTMLRLGQERPVLRIVADQIGSPTSAGDIAAAIGIIVRQPRDQPRLALTGMFRVGPRDIQIAFPFGRAPDPNRTDAGTVTPLRTRRQHAVSDKVHIRPVFARAGQRTQHFSLFTGIPSDRQIGQLARCNIVFVKIRGMKCFHFAAWFKRRFAG